MNAAQPLPDGIPWRDLLYGVGFVTALVGGVFGVTALGYRLTVRREPPLREPEPQEGPMASVEHPQPPSTLPPRPPVAPEPSDFDTVLIVLRQLLLLALVTFGGVQLDIWYRDWLWSSGRCYAPRQCILFHDNRNHALFAAAFGAVALLVARRVRAGALVPKWDRARVARLLELTAWAALVIALWAGATATWS